MHAEKTSAASTSIAQTEEKLEAGIDVTGGLELKKGVSDNGDGTFTVRLEADASGTETTTYQPFDAVVVADCSGSMNYMFGTEKTRETVMKTAVGNFLENMASFNTNLPEGSKSRFALVQFSDAGGGNRENRTRIVQEFTEVKKENLDELNSKVQSLECKVGTHTRTDAGMERAGELISKDTLNRKKVVVLVTDGQPNDREGFQPYVANRAIAAAKTIKEAGAEVFVISMEPSCVAVPGEAFPTYEKIPEDNPKTNANWQSFFYVSDKGNLDKLPTNTEPSNMKNMTNRFMYLVSSDNPHASDMDTPNDRDGSDTGATMVQNFSYYSSPENPEEFLKLFDQLASRSGRADQILGKDAVLFDEVAQDFVLCDPAQAQVWTSAYTKDGTWEDPVPAEGVTCTADSRANTVRVTGFDYSANYVTPNGHADQSGFYGKKLIVTFRIRPVSTTFGGNEIPTNTGRSGMYKDASLTDSLGHFPVPKVDLPLAFSIEGRDRNVFAPDAVSLPELLKYAKDTVPDGANNRYVDITVDICGADGKVLTTLQIPAGKNTEEVRFSEPAMEVPKTCARYTVRCTVTPAAKGSQKAITRKRTQSVHYFFPSLDLKDTELKKGSAIDVRTGELTAGKDPESHLLDLAWLCQDGTKAGVKSAPDLGYRVSALSGVAVQEGTEVLTAEDAAAFDVKVFREKDGALGEEITSLTTLSHSCMRADCNFTRIREREPEADFLIHTLQAGEEPTPSDDTKKSGDAARDSADAGATGSSSVTNNVTIENQITVPKENTGSVQSISSSTPAAAAPSSAVQEANEKAAQAALAANLQAAKEAQEAILKAQQDAASASTTGSVTQVSSATPASGPQVITDRPKTGESGDGDLFVPIAAAAGSVFLVLLVALGRTLRERGAL
ncbi:MAG: vWA domain-containing protein [Lachnospiraceae bacterium]